LIDPRLFWLHEFFWHTGPCKEAVLEAAREGPSICHELPYSISLKSKGKYPEILSPAAGVFGIIRHDALNDAYLGIPKS
jgi:hypothetical protein